MLRALLLAHPAGHSVSPAMHDAAFAVAGIAAHYRAWDVPPEALPSAVRALRDPEVLGANVTIPHKRAVVDLVDRVTEVAAAVGAVNTITPLGDRLEGHNTDVEGFLAALTELPLDPVGSDALVLGAGGAARAVAYALLRAGARVALANRDPERARTLARDLSAHGAVRVLEPTELARAVRHAGLLVNATSVGMTGAAPGSPLPAGLLPDAGAVVDLVYRPAETALVAAARAAGLPNQNGVPMLVHQGAASWTRWTGVPAPVDTMRRAALRALEGSL